MTASAAMMAVSRTRVAQAFPPANAGRATGSETAGPIRLDRSDNAYGPSPRAIAAMRSAPSSVDRQHPERELEALRRAIAARHGCALERVVLGCGSGEILRMAVDAFAGSGRKVIAALPTVELLSESARRAGADVVEVPLRKDYAHDLDAMLACSDPRAGLIYVCNPNDPTGTLTRRRDLEAVVERLPAGARVLVDEGYHDYIGGSPEHASFADRPVDDRRVIVARSFSTIHGLADNSIGYAIAAPEDARLLAKHRPPDQLNVAAAKGAIAALADIDHVRTSISRNANDRQEFFNQANARMLRTIDSHTNFVMLDTGRRAVGPIEHFKRHGILVSWPVPLFDRHIRVALGTAAQMREFWRVWDLLPGHHM